MKIICSKGELVKGTQIVQTIVSPRSTLPILSNFLMEAEGQTIKLSSTDLEVGVSCFIKGEIVKEGSITIPAKRFSDIVRELNDDKNIEIKTDESNEINIKCEKSHFVLMGLPKADYPVLPSFPKEGAFTVSQPVLKKMLRRTVFSASMDETRYVLNGVYLILEEENLKMVATDGRRLSYIYKSGMDKKIERRAIIPSKAVNELQRVLASDDEKEEVKIGLTENQIAFQFSLITIISRLIEGTFPNYEQVIPKKFESQIKVNTKNILSAVRQMALLVSDKTSIVKFFFANNVLRISASAAGLGSGEVELDIDYKGQKLEIAFNPSFLIDIFKNIDEDELYFELTSSLNPAVVRPVNDKNYICVVMPMRL
ncbi:MAG: DNA polymerase III subunit beta [Elusimicrobia bacterium]|nr:DNA polymerase III subunit beta [Candidatus Liberimonas magnetica]